MAQNVIIKLKGGMGNQMFQYAFGLSLAHAAAQSKHAINILFDTSSYASPQGMDTPRKLLIGHCNTIITEATPNQITKVKYPYGYFSRLYRKLKNIITGEFGVGFSQHILLPPYKKYYEGYWQSEKYFTEIADEVRNAFALKSPLSTAAKHMLDTITADPHATSIFYRRTDYIGHPDLDIGEQDYQRRAIAKILELDPNTHLYVMSDDIDWVRTSADLPEGTVFVSSPDIPDYEEITLASACQNNIIPNSTFAWWGAWLNTNPRKYVIMPKLWSKLHNEDWYKDIAPHSWIRV